MNNETYILGCAEGLISDRKKLAEELEEESRYQWRVWRVSGHG